ncbi:hypothetical protein EV421DRAFT_2038606 [Armillaria borealis]|uniref:F-box domain-containing protein n=1 Tax=Armillaria borealis TaxID=47425 RepID=A0AA39MK91_9AGAR|nr:hypothetical protein EV421DRAFT_2038606 [Armillaria borealis]
MQSTLEEILVKHDWISTFTHSPDILSLLRTNDPPSPLQSARLWASFDGLKKALAELQSNLDLLHNATTALQSQMSRLQSFENDYKVALSPIRRIPSEITMEILRCAGKSDNLGNRFLGRRISGFNVFSIQEGPWYLGQVCSSWRNALETLCPELWATVTVEIPLSHHPKVPMEAVEMLRIVLGRSRNHPLDFYFKYYGPDWYERETQAMERCFDLMVTHSKRWRAVELRLPPYLILRLSHVRGRIDSLRDAYLYCCYDPQPGDIHAFEVAPKLETLHLKDMHPEANIRFPVTSLVSFSDARPFAGDRVTPEYLHVVQSAPKLRSFSYNDYGVNLISTPFSIPSVMSRSLQELSASSPNFMRSMVLPLLKDVTLTTTYDLEEGEGVIQCPVGALGALHEMLLQSQCSLTRLCLIDVVLTDRVVNVLQILPGLQKFDIEFHKWVDDYDPVMKLLVTRLSEVNLIDGSVHHSVVPSLQSLGVRLCGLRYTHVSFVDSAFVNMVASRLHRPSEPHFAKLTLWVMGQGWSYDFDRDDELVLSIFEDGGLELDFSLDDGDPETDSDPE